MTEVATLLKEKTVIKKEMDKQIDAARSEYRRKLQVLNNMIRKATEAGVGKRIKQYTRR